MTRLGEDVSENPGSDMCLVPSEICQNCPHGTKFRKEVQRSQGDCRIQKLGGTGNETNRAMS